MNRLTDSKTIGSGFIRNQMVSVIGRLQYTFDDRYIVTASFREDGASQLSPGSKWAFFPSAAVAWRISEERFVKDNADWITNLKLRASYGMTGNYSIAAYATLGSLYGCYANFGFGGETHLPGLEPSTRPAPDLGWERNKMLDIGLDFGFLNGRIFGTVEYYDSKSYDLLYLEGAALHHGLQPGLDEHRRHAQPRLGDFALDGSHPEEGLHPQRQSLLLPQQGGAWCVCRIPA